jgi:ABC-type antimicrobial peptide transport system permease subunit
MKNPIPKIPYALFKLYCRGERYEELHGDLEELFYERLAKSGPRKARFYYWLDVIRCCQPYAWKKISQAIVPGTNGMFRNYFKVSLRSLMKNPVTSFINVFGLAVAIGISLLVYTFLEYDYSIDQFHKNKNEVYLATFFADRDGHTSQYGKTPRPLGDMLKADFKQVHSVCRVEDRSVVLKQEDNVFHEKVRFADAEFLEMFTFPMKWGTPASLADKHTIILSEDMSVKYFGDNNPVGSEILMIFNDTTKKVFTVSGVAEAFPKSHDIEFNFLINFENVQIADPVYDKNDWSEFLNATLVQVDKPEEIDAVTRGMDKYRKLQNEAQPDWVISSFAFEPLVTLHERAVNIKEAIASDDNVEGRIGMPIIAIFMIILACLNYINIAIVSAARRLKEIGIRKAIGANRMKVMVQFLTENIVVTCFALVTGVALCGFVFLPWFVQFSGWPLELRLIDMNIWLFLGVLVLFTGVVSGIYPAVYVSRFDAVRIFRGSQEFGRKNPFTRIFLGVQLVLACMTITAGVVFTQNNNYQNNRSWGYNKDHVLYAGVPDQQAYGKLKNSVISNPNVVSLTGSADHLGRATSKALVRLSADRHYEVNQFAVDAGYFETMGLQLNDGRVFRQHSESDKQAIVVNETLVEKLDLDQPIGQQFEIDSVKYEIIGVLKEFHHLSFFNRVQPTIFKLADEADFRYLSLSVREGSEKEVHAALLNEWASLYPEIPFQGGYQQDVWPTYFFSVDRSETFTNVIASIAVLLASLGLYGLVALNVSGRTKEFSLRRTLGAGIRHVSTVIISQYRVLTIVALIFGAPLSYWFAQAYLDMLFAYPMPIDYSGIVISLAILIFVLLAVISTQIRKVLVMNPIEGLREQ